MRRSAPLKRLSCAGKRKFRSLACRCFPSSDHSRFTDSVPATTFIYSTQGVCLVLSWDGREKCGCSVTRLTLRCAACARARAAHQRCGMLQGHLRVRSARRLQLDGGWWRVTLHEAAAVVATRSQPRGQALREHVCAGLAAHACHSLRALDTGRRSLVATRRRASVTTPTPSLPLICEGTDPPASRWPPLPCVPQGAPVPRREPESCEAAGSSPCSSRS